MTVTSNVHSVIKVAIMHWRALTVKSSAVFLLVSFVKRHMF